MSIYVLQHEPVHCVMTIRNACCVHVFMAAVQSKTACWITAPRRHVMELKAARA